MIEIMQSTAKEENPQFVESKRKPDEDNVAWVKRHCPKTTQAVLLLFGGVDQVSFRVRVAQSHARHNLTPSHWSDVVLVKNPDGITTRTQTFEASLQPTGGFGFPTSSNGIQSGTLAAYRDAKQFPNVAILQVPVAGAKVKEAIEQFQVMRHVVNGVDLLVAWLAHVWGVTSADNPLLREIGVPSAVLMEYATGAVGFDLTPGLASRSSCPEAIWQAAKWWHRFYITRGEEGGEQVIPTRAAQPAATESPIIGKWCVDNILGQGQG
jgi:hypothetical protein